MLTVKSALRDSYVFVLKILSKINKMNFQGINSLYTVVSHCMGTVFQQFPYHILNQVHNIIEINWMFDLGLDLGLSKREIWIFSN